MATHKINRTILELEYDSLESALNNREQLGAELISSLEQTIENLYARLPDNGAVIEIEKLEIDLGLLTANLDKIELGAKIETLLGQELAKWPVWKSNTHSDRAVITANSSNGHQAGSDIEYVSGEHYNAIYSSCVSRAQNLETQKSNQGLAPAELAADSPLAGRSSQQLQEKLLHFYLAGGFIPWWSEDPDPDLEKIATELIAKNPEKIRVILASLPQHIFNRIALEFSRSLHEKLAVLMAENLITTDLTSENEQSGIYSWQLIRVRGELKKLLEGTRESVTKLADLALTGNITEKLIRGLKNAQLIRLYIKLKNSALGRIQFRELVHSADCSSMSFKEFKSRLQLYLKTSTGAAPEDGSLKIATQTVTQKYKQLKKLERECLLSLAQEIENTRNIELPGQGLLVENAGLVILAPYLPALFSALGLTSSQGQFINKKAALKAVLILHKLGGGRSVKTINNFPLNKLLIGLPFNESIPVNIRLSRLETKEIKELLGSVLVNWAALKNSSTGALQHNFFKRKGVLKIEGDHHTLTVERREFDLLLDSMPWSFKLLRFSWFTTYFIEVLW